MKKISLILFLITIIMLGGCSNDKDIYNKDLENLGKLDRVNKLIEDTYREVVKKDYENLDEVQLKFSQFCDKAVKEAKKIDIKTKEGKEYKIATIKRIEYLKEYLITNWGKYFEDDKGLFKIDSERSKIANEFLNKKEEITFNGQ